MKKKYNKRLWDCLWGRLLRRAAGPDRWGRGSPPRPIPAGSVGVLLDVEHDVQQRRPRLGGGGDDLGAGQEEAVAPRVPQLEGVGIFHPVLVGPVHGGAGCHVCGERR